MRSIESCRAPGALGWGLALAGVLAAGCGEAPQAAGGDGSEAGPRPLNVGFLVVDGVYNSELMAPWDIFHHTVFHTEPGMRVFMVAPSHDVITSFEGMRLIPDHDFQDAPPIDVLVVPSAEHSMDSDLEDAELMAWVERVGAEADYVVSLCDGAFVLAAAGLLDGVNCTTFPGDIAAFKERFDAPLVHEEVVFVHDGKAITSAGGARSYDPALYLCELLYGAEVARGIGRGLVLEWDVAEVPHVIAEDRP